MYVEPKSRGDVTVSVAGGRQASESKPAVISWRQRDKKVCVVAKETAGSVSGAC